jgi:hypothetical protein
VPTSGAHRVGRYEVVTRSQDRIGHNDRSGHPHLGFRGGAGVSGFIDTEPVEVADAFHARFVLGKRVEQRRPDSLRNPDLDGNHAAAARLDGPRYAELVRAA